MHTHGWDLFAPSEAVLYHLYSREHRPTFQKLQQVQVPHPSASVAAAGLGQSAAAVAGSSSGGGVDGTAGSSVEATKRCSMRAVRAMLRLDKDATTAEDAEEKNLQELNDRYYGLG